MTSTPSEQHPIATTAATSHSSLTWSHSPIVRAMLTNNRMTNCHDVATMVQDCKASASEDRICQTATSYLNICLHKGGKTL